MGILNFFKEMAIDIYKDQMKQKQNIEKRYYGEADRVEKMSDEELREYAKRKRNDYKSDKGIEGVAAVHEMQKRGFGEKKKYQ